MQNPEATSSSPTLPESALQRRIARFFRWLNEEQNVLPDERLAVRTTWTLAVSFWLLFVLYIQFPATLNFDEYHYIPSARQFLALAENRNYEHPPLGKELIALGMALFGDRPIGWRFMSTVFGALTVAGTYVAGLALFRTQLSAVFVALITGFNNLVYVQARIAMLDTFMAGFLVWSFAFGLRALFPLDSAVPDGTAPEGRRRDLAFSGVALGLACACKWFALVPWAALLALMAAYRLLHFWKVRFDSPARTHSTSTFFPLPESGLSVWDFLKAWVLLPVAAYYATFLPFLWTHKANGNAHSLSEILFTMQKRMWNGQLRVISPHPYSSTWLQWPLMSRPIWYAFVPFEEKRWVRGVVLIGNPLVLWGGLAALLFTTWDWIRTRSFAAFWILTTYCALTLSWAVIPRKIAFFYYYYPSALILGFAWTYALQRITNESAEPHQRRVGLVLHLLILAGTVALFAYFLPVLAAWKIPFTEYRNWMWFRRWI